MIIRNNFQKINMFEKPKKTRKNYLKPVYRTVTFLLSLIAFIFASVIGFLGKLLPKKARKGLEAPCNKVYGFVENFCNSGEQHTISRISLIELSFKNMSMKKSRTLITIGGMAVGIGAIVFLVSIGYGLQELVISRVAKLEEMKQADVTHQNGSKIHIDDWAVNKFKEIQDVTDVLPMISVVGTVNYQDSSSDMAVYGVTSDYLRNSAIKTSEGGIFENNQTTVEISSSFESQSESDYSALQQEMDESIEVAGVQTSESEVFEYGEELREVEFSLGPGNWIRVRKEPGIDSEILGYTKRVEGIQLGKEVAGSKYKSEDESGEFGEDQKGKVLGKWISTKVLLWEKKECDVNESVDCVKGRFVVVRDEESYQVQQGGYIAELGVEVKDYEGGMALSDGGENPIVKGEKIALADSIEASELDWADLGAEAPSQQEEQIKEVEVSSPNEKEAVVNRAMLKILNIEEKEAVGKIFSVSFSAVGEMLENPEEKIRSAAKDYRITGVVPEEKTPFFYVPFIDLRSMGITNYSQAKVVSDNQDVLSDVRKKVEALGFVTSSVVDTVNQISSLFATARMMLGLVGMIALAVASLGMFNTLTVSLLERTREVGLMKAMGMRSMEIRELFLVESMLMGFFGGVFGILMGYAGGELLGLVLSTFSFFKGIGTVDVTHIPWMFIVIILTLSLFVGVGTGIYPAKRAKKISALNALRYE